MTPEQFSAAAPIHADSLVDFQTWETLLRKWNARINLVAPKSLPDFWRRHALDSAQVCPYVSDTDRTIVDFGSGAGFPGLAVAIQSKHTGSHQTVHLIESVGKKASFLKTVSRETQLPTEIHGERIENIEPLNADIITARAFAPLERLLPLAKRHLIEGGKIILLKGEAVEAEVALAKETWAFNAQKVPSLSDDTGCILIITDLKAK